MYTTKTPSDLTILPREPNIDFVDCLGRDWHGEDPFKTAYFNAFSITFPAGEKFFIDAVRAFTDDVGDPTLSEQMRGFVGQEGRHRREHQDYNEALCERRGYDLAAMEAKQLERLKWMKENTSRYQWLAATVALEHITAIMANGILHNPAWLHGAEEPMAELWRWHALEELEHKSVAFDVYRACEGWDKTRRQLLKIVTWHLFRDTLSHTREMLRRVGLHNSPSVWLGGMQFLFGSNGIWRPLIPEWRDFSRADFHPWDIDNRDLLAHWAQRFTQVGASA
jgi:uncharacterized protein